MKNFLLYLCMSCACCAGSILEAGARLVEGSISFTFIPITYPGSTGTWQPIVLSPGGAYVEGPTVACADATPITVTATCCQGYTEIGTYGIVLKNRVVGSVDTPLVSSMVVTPNVPSIPFDTMTYKNISPTSDGENTIFFYRFPSMETD